MEPRNFFLVDVNVILLIRVLFGICMNSGIFFSVVVYLLIADVLEEMLHSN